MDVRHCSVLHLPALPWKLIALSDWQCTHLKFQDASMGNLTVPQSEIWEHLAIEPYFGHKPVLRRIIFCLHLQYLVTQMNGGTFKQWCSQFIIIRTRHRV